MHLSLKLLRDNSSFGLVLFHKIKLAMRHCFAKISSLKYYNNTLVKRNVDSLSQQLCFILIFVGIHWLKDTNLIMFKKLY